MLCRKGNQKRVAVCIFYLLRMCVSLNVTFMSSWSRGEAGRETETGECIKQQMRGCFDPHPEH